MASSRNSSSGDHSLDGTQGEANSEQVQLHFSKDEEELIVRMYNLVGNRWSLIAGRIPGRTAEEIKKYWIEKKDALKEK